MRMQRRNLSLSLPSCIFSCDCDVFNCLTVANGDLAFCSRSLINHARCQRSMRLPECISACQYARHSPSSLVIEWFIAFEQEQGRAGRGLIALRHNWWFVSFTDESTTVACRWRESSYVKNRVSCRSIRLFSRQGFPNPWDVILNKRRFEYAMVSRITIKRRLNVSSRNSKVSMIHGTWCRWNVLLTARQKIPICYPVATINDWWLASVSW